jgi:hypothetical protein
MDEIAELGQVQVFDGFNVQLTFTDGTIKTVDLDRYLIPGQLYDPLRQDPALFRAAFVENGAITWPNGADIDSDVLYLGLRPGASEEEWRAAQAAHAAQQVVR